MRQGLCGWKEEPGRTGEHGRVPLRPLDLVSRLQLAMDRSLMMCLSQHGESPPSTSGLSARCALKPPYTRPWFVGSAGFVRPVADA
jgi:hypothetical protein